MNILLVHPKDEVGDVCIFLLLEVFLKPRECCNGSHLNLLCKYELTMRCKRLDICNKDLLSKCEEAR